MSTTEEEMRTLLQRYVNAAEGKGLVDDTIVDPNILLHFRFGGEARGINLLEESFRDINAAFPELSQTIEDVIINGDTLAARVAVNSGPHNGTPWIGLLDERTKGRSFNVYEFHFLRFENGRIAEQWIQADMFSLMEDIGFQAVLIEN